MNKLLGILNRSCVCTTQIRQNGGAFVCLSSQNGLDLSFVVGWVFQPHSLHDFGELGFVTGQRCNKGSGHCRTTFRAAFCCIQLLARHDAADQLGFHLKVAFILILWHVVIDCLGDDFVAFLENQEQVIGDLMRSLGFL